MPVDPYADALTAIVNDAVELIRTTRQQRGLTHYAMAKAAHISRQTPANVEAGPKDPGLMMLVRFWWALDIPAAELARLMEHHRPGPPRLAN